MVSTQFREYIWSKYLVCFVLLAPYSSPQSYSSPCPTIVPGILPWSILWPNLLVSASWLRSWHLSKSEPNGNPCLGFLKLDSKNIYKSVILNDGSSQIWEKAMATYSSILAWRIHEPRSLTGHSPWGHRVRHNWRDLACMRRSLTNKDTKVPVVSQANNLPRIYGVPGVSSCLDPQGWGN